MKHTQPNSNIYVRTYTDTPCLLCGPVLGPLVQMIQLYQTTLSNMSALDKVAFFPMVRLECEQAKGGLTELAEGYLTRLHTSLAEQHIRENQR